jgi:hypothetical protein
MARRYSITSSALTLGFVSGWPEIGNWWAIYEYTPFL